MPGWSLPCAWVELTECLGEAIYPGIHMGVAYPVPGWSYIPWYTHGSGLSCARVELYTLVYTWEWLILCQGGAIYPGIHMGVAYPVPGWSYIYPGIHMGVAYPVPGWSYIYPGIHMGVAYPVPGWSYIPWYTHGSGLPCARVELYIPWYTHGSGLPCALVCCHPCLICWGLHYRQPQDGSENPPVL